FFSSRRRHTRFSRDWSSDVCSSDLGTVEADIVRFDSIDARRAAPEGSLAGKIAFIDQHMERTRDGSGYGKAGAVRRHGPSEAIRRGAAGSLMRSIGPSPHGVAETGST